MIQRTPANPNVKVAIAELSKHNNLLYFFLTEGVNVKEPWVAVLAVGIVALAAVGSGAAGWIVGVIIKADKDVVIALALCSGGLIGMITGWRVLDALLDAAAARYEAEMSERPETGAQRAGLVQVTPRRTIKLSADDKRLLTVFGQRYPVIDTLAYNAWEENTPLTRNDVRQIRRLVLRMGAAVTKSNGEVELNDFGEAQVPLWAAGNFSEVEDNPPTPEGA